MRLIFLTICIASLLAYAETIYTSLDNKSLESSSLAKHHDRSFFFSGSYNIGYFYGENKDFEERYSFNIEGFSTGLGLKVGYTLFDIVTPHFTTLYSIADGRDRIKGCNSKGYGYGCKSDEAHEISLLIGGGFVITPFNGILNGLYADVNLGFNFYNYNSPIVPVGSEDGISLLLEIGFEQFISRNWAIGFGVSYMPTLELTSCTEPGKSHKILANIHFTRN